MPPADDFLSRTITLARAIVARWEGCERRIRGTNLIVPYLCPAGYWTIGYGRLVAADHPPISILEAELFLHTDLLRHLRYVYELAPTVADSPPRAAALCSFVYNLGPGAFRASTLRRCVLQSDWIAAADQFPRWIFAGGKPLEGLKRRRAEERQLFLSAD